MSRMNHALVTVLAAIVITAIASASNWRDDAEAIDVSGGEDHTLVLTRNRWAWACGDNYYYQLGIGNNQDQKSLIQIEDGNMVTISGYLEDINDIDAGWKHSLALDVNGFVWSWGWNSQGQLGDDFQNERTTPVKVKSGEQDPESGE